MPETISTAAAAIPAIVTERNAAFVQQLKGKLILAPLTRGGNLPFRRLCVDLGAEATMSEMAFARGLIK
jgi:tRNA-dihydrouridine synthase 3